MTDFPAIYWIEDLISITGVSRRTIYSWVEKGLIPRATVRGRPGPHWSEEHVRAIRRVQKIKEEQVTYADLAERFHYRERDEAAS